MALFSSPCHRGHLRSVQPKICRGKARTSQACKPSRSRDQTHARHNSAGTEWNNYDSHVSARSWIPSSLRVVTISTVTLRYATLRFVTHRYASLRFITLRYASLRFTCFFVPSLLRFDTLRHATLRFFTLRTASLRYGTPRYASLRYGTLRYASYATLRSRDAIHDLARLRRVSSGILSFSLFPQTHYPQYIYTLSSLIIKLRSQLAT